MIPSKHIPDSLCNPPLPIYYFTILRTLHSEKGGYKNRTKRQQIHIWIAATVVHFPIYHSMHTTIYCQVMGHPQDICIQQAKGVTVLHQIKTVLLQ